MARRVIAMATVALGLVMAVAGTYALLVAWGSGEVISLPGKIGDNLRDQGIVALMGAVLAVMGAARLMRKEQPNE